MARRRPPRYAVRMTDALALDELRELYAEAFLRFGPQYLWNVRRVDDPKPGNALSVGYALRQEGDMDARRFAERLERAARGAD